MNVETRRQRLNDLASKGISLPSGVYTAIDSETPPASLQGWSWHAFLWDRPRATTWTQHEATLGPAQQRWDASEKHVAAMRTLEEERHARESEAQRVRDAEVAAERQDELDRVTEQLRRVYLAQPGTTPEGFAKALPEMLEQRARETTLATSGTIPSPMSRHQILG
jgi:hypothetical protein